MNVKLKAIAEKAASDLLALIKESEEKILDAWNAAEEEAQENETAPKFKLGLSITLDLDADSMETALTYGIRHKLTAQCTIPDPNQTNLPLDGGDPTVTISTPGVKPVTLTQKQFAKAAEKLGGKK